MFQCVFGCIEVCDVLSVYCVFSVRNCLNVEGDDLEGALKRLDDVADILAEDVDGWHPLFVRVVVAVFGSLAAAAGGGWPQVVVVVEDSLAAAAAGDVLSLFLGVAVDVFVVGVAGVGGIGGNAIVFVCVRR